MQWLRKLFKREQPEIPEALWRECRARLPFLDRLDTDELGRLKALAETLLAAKGMRAAGGLELSDRIAALVAVQAALPVLNLNLGLYDDMATIIVYPSAFIVPFSEVDDDGVVHEWQEPLAGEALHAGGAVVLSWEDSEDQGEGCNVVIHEFAHKIDMANGDANGSPPFLAAFHRGLSPVRWQEEFSAAYADFCGRVDALERSLPAGFDPDDEDDAAWYDELAQDLPLDPYAAHNPAEFFAVASEAFFVQPGPLAADYPEIYRLLAQYYRQDPLRPAPDPSAARQPAP